MLKMFETTSKFFGIISVKERNNQVRITGIDGMIMRDHFKHIFETDAVSKHMFSLITDTSLVFNAFFIPDVVFMLTKLRESPTCRWALRRTIDRILSGIMKNTWYSMTIGPVKSIIDMSQVSRMKWKPMEKQVEFLHLYGDKIPRYGLKGYILGFAPGGGKTFTDLLLATCIIPPSVAEVKIIISPKKALHLVWAKSVRAVFNKTPTYWTSDSTTKMPLTNNEYYIFNFEQLEEATKLAAALRSRGIKFFVIVDESHNFADYRSTRTQRLVNLQTMDNCSYFVWTSGSPILKTGAELTSFLKCADPRFDIDAERRFRKIYTNAPGRANEIFNHRLGQQMAFTVAKHFFSPTKPIVKELPVKLPPSLAKQFLMSTVREDMKKFIAERLVFYQQNIKDYRKIATKWMDYHEATLGTRPQRAEFAKYSKNLRMIMQTPDRVLGDTLSDARKYERMVMFPTIPPTSRREFRNALSAIKNIKLKVRGEALGTVLSKRRSLCAATLGIYCKPDEIMKESLSKTLFFASSVLPIKALEQFLTNKGFHPLAVYAETNSQLTSIMDRFESDPNINPVCATMQSLSEAVPVTAASTVVLLNRPFRHAVWDQVVSRADRLGQLHPVTVIEVTLDTGNEPNVSSTTDAILAEVRELINDIVGPDFAGPPLDEREYKDVIDASTEEPLILNQDEIMGL
jgi:hypothetical protein